MTMKKLLSAVLMSFALFATPAFACPLCKDAIPESADGATEADPERQSSGYNDSIYFMLAVPAGLVGVMGLMLYRQCRKVDAGNAT
jgi:hypothetical protein